MGGEGAEVPEDEEADGVSCAGGRDNGDCTVDTDADPDESELVATYV